MADIGPLAIKLTANSQVASGIDRAKAELRRFRRDVERDKGLLSGVQVGGIIGQLAGGGNIAGVFAALPGPIGAAAAAVAQFGSAVARAAQELDALGKEADRLEITTESLQSMRHAADLAGLDTETLTAAMDRLNRQVGEAASGSLQAQAAFRDLGLDAQQLAARGLDRSFEDIAEALARIPSRSERARLSFEIFGRQSARLDALLRGGREGIARARRELEAMGALSSRAEIANVETMNDAITTLNRGLRGGLERFAVEIAPAITRAVQDITGAVGTFSSALGGLGRSAGELLEILREFHRISPGTQAIAATRRDTPFGQAFADLTGHELNLLGGLANFARPIPFQPLAGSAIGAGIASAFPEGAAVPHSVREALARRALQEASQAAAQARGPAALSEGSAEAISLVNRFRLQREGQQDRITAAIQAGIRIQEHQRRELAEIRRVLESGVFAQATF